jgi:biopolymer transport protein ExbD
MTLRRRSNGDEEAGVNLSPLIDCVFLLLIFFLVTTMFKKFEHQIPIRMPDITSSLSEESQEDVLHIGMSAAGAFHRERAIGTRGELLFQRAEELGTILGALAKTRRHSDPVRLVVEKQTRFQDVISALDQFQHAGFQDVDVRVTNRIAR